MTRSFRYLMVAPSTPRRIAAQLLQLLALAVAVATMVLVLSATAEPTEAPAPLQLPTDTVERVRTPGPNGGLQ
jgi:hypothetical protein